MIITPRAIEQIADRIERAFLRRRPEWRQAGLDPRLWSAAGAILMDAHRRSPWLPLDPELFVASQAPESDPWRELTRATSGRRYLSRVRKIVRGLRRELRDELRRVEVAIRRGSPLEVILLGPSRHLSPLGRYLAAISRDRSDLAARFEEEARLQHAACPLYRQAAEGLVADDAYLILPILPEPLRTPGSSQFSLN